MKKCIGIYSLLMGLYGTIAVLIRTMDPEWITNMRWLYLSPVYFNYSFRGGFSWVVDGVFHLMLLTGGVFYLQRQSDRSGLLRFCFSIMFFSTVISVLWRLIGAKMNLSYSERSPIEYWLWTLYPAAMLLISFWAVKFMQKDFVVTDTTVEKDNLFATPAPKNVRLAHLAFDFLIVFGLMSPLTGLFGIWTEGKHIEFHQFNRYIFLFILGFHRFFYYGLMESLFKVTPVKFLTGSSVVNEYGTGIPSASRMWGRTCCRFIPFEPFSFLGTRGWHDALLQTMVIKDAAVRPGRPYTGIWISLLILLPLGKAGFDYYREHQEKVLRNKYYSETERLSKESIVRNLSTDDLIVYRSTRYTRKQARRIFKVEEVTADTLWGYTFLAGEGSINYKNVIAAYQNSTPGDTLRSMVRKTLESMMLERTNGELFGDGQLYDNDISIYTLHHPKISLGSSNTQKRTGEPAKANWMFLVEQEKILLKSITTLEGDIEWKTTFPLELNWQETEGMGYFKITAENFRDDKRHQSLFVFESEDGRQFEYIGLGMGSKLSLYRK